MYINNSSFKNGTDMVICAALIHFDATLKRTVETIRKLYWVYCISASVSMLNTVHREMGNGLVPITQKQTRHWKKNNRRQLPVSRKFTKATYFNTLSYSAVGLNLLYCTKQILGLSLAKKCTGVEYILYTKLYLTSTIPLCAFNRQPFWLLTT